jgi:hypothetical protein
LRTKKDRKSRDDRSAQWTSSKTSTSGCASARRPSSASSSSNRRPCERGVSAAGASSWGSSGARPTAAPAQLVGAQPPQGADDRREGQLAVAEVDAVAGEHARALGAGAGAELGDQAGLADARLAGDERDRGPAIGRALERRGEARELALAPHELRTRDPLGQLPRPSTGRVYAAMARQLIGRR